MKTIRQPKQTRPFNVTCPNQYCEAVLEATIDEFELEGDDNAFKYYSAPCPHCSTHITLSEQKMKTVAYGTPAHRGGMDDGGPRDDKLTKYPGCAGDPP